MKRGKRVAIVKVNRERLVGFPGLLRDIKARIRHAQSRALLAANAELVQLYWDIGRLIDERQKRAGWGAAVIPKLARELQDDLAEAKGFSERNIKRMLAFYREYCGADRIVPPPVAQLPSPEKVPPPVAQLDLAGGRIPGLLLWAVPWAHHVILLEKVKAVSARAWYMQQTLANGWSRNVLLSMIESRAHRRQGKAVTNFGRLLPPQQSELARQTLKDPYIFDFLTLDEPFHERELEVNLLRQVERFLLELGQGFAFVGRQFHLEIGGSDFYIDLLFYHLRLRCFVVIDLKKGEFKPEYAGKMNFYLSVVDEKFRHPEDRPSIGLILCQDRNHIVAEYALRGVSKPIGVSEYELTRALPKQFRSALPTVQAIEAELSRKPAKPSAPQRRPKQRSKPAAAKKVRRRRRAAR